ncbi:hypothetical protein DFS34DRAFT_591633 [Phlyctochytrium arcticum]|nr:hypothetical protein DFS34DRAFT_591633 [Phlyctochytrium arcticum]
MAFRLHGTCFLITWSQLNIEDALPTLLQRILLLLRVFGPTTFPRLAHERHSDGNSHYHAVVIYESRIDRRLSTQWDIDGRHPNVKSKGSRNQRRTAIAYLEKDGEYLDEEQQPALGPESTGTDLPDLASELALHATFPSWLQWCFHNSVPFGYASEFWKSSRLGAETLDDATAFEGEIHDARLLDLHLDPQLDRAPVIIGHSGCGKTTWARREAPKPVLFKEGVLRSQDMTQYLRVSLSSSLMKDPDMIPFQKELLQRLQDSLSDDALGPIWEAAQEAVGLFNQKIATAHANWQMEQEKSKGHKAKKPSTTPQRPFKRAVTTAKPPAKKSSPKTVLGATTRTLTRL